MRTPEINRAAAEDLRAQLVSRFRGPLIAYFSRRIRDRSEAEDLTQETLARILGSPSVTHLEHAQAYVFTTASNLLKEYRRKSLRFPPSACVPIDEAVASELES